ncbi:AI-2E family transporter [Chitinimonas lacunae]|uniref:AI-2E family transporter n=1 Tax=Chitinimonas lacunae TaxID=1963018 RepID=A0ABV8MMV5_9NEIS
MNEQIPSAWRQLNSPNWVGKSLLLIAAVFLLQAARVVAIPIALALVLVFTLSWPVRWLRRYGIPRPLSACIVLVSLLGSVMLAGTLLMRPAVDWWERAPANMEQLLASIDRLRAAVPILAPPAPSGRQVVTPASDPLKEKIASEGVAFTGVLLRNFGTLAVTASATLILAYLLLIYERWIISHMVEALSKRRQRAMVLGSLRHAQRQIARFLSTMTLVNIGLGVTTGIAMTLVGVPNPFLWGAVAGVLNFIPYFGPFVTMVLLTLTGVSTFDSLGMMLAPPAAYALIHAVEANIFTPLIVGRRLQLSQLAIFASVLFWGWLWGVAGAFLAVPILIGIRCVCRRRRIKLLCIFLAPNDRAHPSLSALLAVKRKHQQRRQAPLPPQPTLDHERQR